MRNISFKLVSEQEVSSSKTKILSPQSASTGMGPAVLPERRLRLEGRHSYGEEQLGWNVAGLNPSAG